MYTATIHAIGNLNYLEFGPFVSKKEALEVGKKESIHHTIFFDWYEIKKNGRLIAQGNGFNNTFKKSECF